MVYIRVPLHFCSLFLISISLFSCGEGFGRVKRVCSKYLFGESFVKKLDFGTFCCHGKDVPPSGVSVPSN